MGGEKKIHSPDQGASGNALGTAPSDLTRRGLLVLSALGMAAAGQGAALAASPEGQLTWAVHI